MKFLLSKGAFVGSEDFASSTALHFAALRGHLDVVQVLLQNYAPIDAINDVQMTAAACAAVSGNRECFELIIKSGALWNVTYTPFHMVSLFGKAKEVRWLHDEYADIVDVNDCSNPMKWTPLHCAVSSGDIETVKTILKYGGDANKNDSQGRKPIDCIPPDCPDAVVKELQRIFGKNEASVIQRAPKDKFDTNNNGPVTMEDQFKRLDDASKRARILRWVNPVETASTSISEMLQGFQSSSGMADKVQEARKIYHNIEVHKLYSAIRADEEFQEDMRDEDTAKAVELLRKDPSKYEAYASKPKIGSVLSKLRRLHGNLQRIGQKNLNLDAAVARNSNAQAADKEHLGRLQQQYNQCLKEISVLAQGFDCNQEEMDDLEDYPKVNIQKMLLRNLFTLIVILVFAFVFKWMQESKS